MACTEVLVFSNSCLHGAAVNTLLQNTWLQLEHLDLQLNDVTLAAAALLSSDRLHLALFKVLWFPIAA